MCGGTHLGESYSHSVLHSQFSFSFTALLLLVTRAKQKLCSIHSEKKNTFTHFRLYVNKLLALRHLLNTTAPSTLYLNNPTKLHTFVTPSELLTTSAPWLKTNMQVSRSGTMLRIVFSARPSGNTALSSTTRLTPWAARVGTQTSSGASSATVESSKPTSPNLK